MLDENQFQKIIPVISGKDISEVNILPSLNKLKDLMVKTCRYFFVGPGISKGAPFKGFLLYGKPGSGKTELVKQVAKELDVRLGNRANIYLLFIDGSIIAAPKWGEAEQRLHAVFNKAEYLSEKEAITNPKVIILFDDIESLMLGRSAELAKEWHYSINSVFFHGVDNVNPTNTMIFATTNREDLVDDAIKNRLYPIFTPLPQIDELIKIVNEILELTGVSNSKKENVIKTVKEKLIKLKEPTIRDAKQLTVAECIGNGVWI